MSILINMEMPKRCWDCFCFDFELDDCLALGGKAVKDYDKRRDDCPLIELPPHGRLIEDTVLDNMTMWNTNREYDRGWDSAVQAAKNRIKSAPTIIESEE